MCKSLELINQGGEIRVNSRVIAMDFEKEHKNIKRDIQNLISSNLSVSKMFIINEYKDSMNRTQQEYFINRDGFSLLVMGFTGQKALEWKLKYIEAFNKMEKQLKIFPQMTIEDMMIQQLEEQKKLKMAVRINEESIKSVENNMNNFKEDIPLFNVECKELQSFVRRKGIEILGGKKSKAYENNSLRGKVYADIQRQIKREFGVNRYENIKRIQFARAVEIVKNYQTPLVLQDEITLINNQIKMI